MTDGPIPVVAVHPADPDDVSEVSIHVSLDNPKAASRFWREVPVTRVGDSCVGDSCVADIRIGETPFMRSGETLYAFATVSYGSGARLSSRVIELSTATFPGRPTLVPTGLIDPMEDDRGWYWVPAYTEPLTYDHYFLPWTGPTGTRGFTLNTRDFLLPTGPDNRLAFDIATQRLGDPQWRGTGQTRLLIDVWAPHALLELTVRAVERCFSLLKHDHRVGVEPRKRDCKPGGGHGHRQRQVARLGESGRDRVAGHGDGDAGDRDTAPSTSGSSASARRSPPFPGGEHRKRRRARSLRAGQRN